MPAAWAGEGSGWADGPESAVAWLRGLAARRAALLRWQARIAGDKGGGAGVEALLSAGPLRLQDLFRPGTFLNALRQLTARRLIAAGGSGGSSVSMDSLKLVCAWERPLLARAPLCIGLEGLLLQGAALDPARSLLTDALLDASETQLTPELFVAWVAPDFGEPYGKEVTTVAVPLYVADDRERLLADLLLPCSGDKARWILCGVAMVLTAS